MDVFAVTVTTDLPISDRQDTYLVGANSTGPASRLGLRLAQAEALENAVRQRAKKRVTCIRLLGELNTRSSVPAYAKELEAKAKKAAKAAKAERARMAQLRKAARDRKKG